MAKGKITTKIDLKALITDKMSKVKNLDFLKRKTVAEIADVTCDVIRNRTRSGIGADEDGNAVRFKGYAESYRKVRIKKGLSTSPVDLTVTGDFLDGLRPSNIQSNKNFTISFHPSDRGKARGAQEGVIRKDGIVRRPVLGLTKTDKGRIWSEVKELVKADLEDYLSK